MALCCKDRSAGAVGRGGPFALAYNSSMKIKTSITLSREVLAELDRLVSAGTNRSRLIERAVREFIANTKREQRDAADRATLNAHHEKFSRVMEETLDYQSGGG